MTATVNVVKLRAEFLKLKEIARYGATAAEWMTAVRKLLPPDPTPQQWVEAAKKARVKCDNCRGTGRYSWGVCNNGVMSHSGPCFRCQSVGTQGQEDFKRNQYYDNHRRVY